MERHEEMFRYAYTQSPYYQSLLDEKNLSIDALMKDWTKVPVVDKKDLVDAGKDIFSLPMCNSPEAEQMIPRTSLGSTGLCMKVLWNRKDMACSMTFLWDCRRILYRIFPEDRNCYFYSYPEVYEGNPVPDNGGPALGFSMLNLNSRRIEEIYNAMWDYQPKWVLMPPSVALMFADYINASGAAPIPSLEYIELTGELVSNRQKAYIANAFQSNTINLYGCSEMNVIAYECPEGHLHLMEDNVLVEIMDGDKVVPDGEEGEIVLTSLWNRTTPFVRYRIGDIGRICSERCPCKLMGRILEITKGRDNDMIQIDNEIDVPSYEFHYVFECIMDMAGIDILQYQVEQTSYFSYIVSIVVKDKNILSDEQTQQEIQQIFKDNLEHEYLRNKIYTFRFRDKIFPDKATDKLRAFWSFKQGDADDEN